MSDETAKAVEWVAATTASAVIEWREAAILEIECTAAKLRTEGLCDAWFNGADSDVRRVATRVNGPLAEILVARMQYSDPGVVEPFRQGAKVLGQLPCTGIHF